MMCSAKCGKHRVIQVHHGNAVRIQRFPELSLLFHDALDRFKPLKVGRVYIGDDRDSGRADLCQPLHFSRNVYSHFHDSDAVLFAQAEQRERKANQVIEIALVFQHFPSSAENGRDHFFGAGLAVAAGNGDYRDVELHAVAPRQFAERVKGVAYSDDGRRSILGKDDGLRHDYRASPLTNGVRNEGVAVVVFSGEGNEAVSRRNLPRVCGNRPDLRSWVPGKYLASRSLSQCRYSPEHILYCPVGVLLKYSLTTSLSSNECLRVPTIW